VFPLALHWLSLGLLVLYAEGHKTKTKKKAQEQKKRTEGKWAEESKSPSHEPKSYSARRLSNLSNRGLVNLAGIGFRPGRAAVFGMASCGQWKNELQEGL